MEQKLFSLGIRQAGDVRSLIEHNNSLPYKERDVKLSALYDLIVAYNNAAPKRKRVTCSDDAYACLIPHMRDLDHEEVWVIYLNRVNDVLETKRMFVGGWNSSTIDAKPILKEALLKKASSIIIAHNHPSGEVKPSKQDKAMTAKLKNGCDACDINLMDHLVISGNKFHSMADEEGL